ncbi:MAG TPA: hypothetical protein VGF55_19740 [Gemmataceae bacterium]|jgi:hypothetical protein
MPDDQRLEPCEDGMHPPAIPTEVFCLHCRQVYESYLIEWRVKTCRDGRRRGFWSCPNPDCDGVGFGCDLLPTDPEYQDERGGWVHDEDDEDEAYEDSDDFADPPDANGDTPGDDADIPF